MSQTVSAARALVRISVVSEGRRLDVGVPARLPLIELMPGFARNLGVLDATMTHAGYELHRADGDVLDPSRSAAEQHVADGEVLTLARGGLVAQSRVYDDVVEAVIDATERQHRPWKPQDSARTALGTSLTLLAVCVVALIAAGGTLGVGPLIAGVGALVLIGVAAVIARLGQSDAGHALGVTAVVFAAVSGYLAAASHGPVWAVPMAAAGTAALVSAGVVIAVMPQRREIPAGAALAGMVIAITAGLSALLPGHTVTIWALMLAVVATAGNALPWAVLSSTRITVISPHSDAEMFADPGPVDADDIARRTAAASRGLLSARLGLGACMLLATPLTAADGTAGALLCILAFLGTMFPARQLYARNQVMASMTLGTIGLGLTGVVTALTQPGLQPLLLGALAVATAVTVTVALLSPKVRMRLSRLADTAELLILAALLPVGVIAAGLV